MFSNSRGVDLPAKKKKKISPWRQQDANRGQGLTCNLFSDDGKLSIWWIRFIQAGVALRLSSDAAVSRKLVSLRKSAGKGKFPCGSGVPIA